MWMRRARGLAVLKLPISNVLNAVRVPDVQPFQLSSSDE